MSTPLSDDAELLAAEMAFHLIEGDELRAAQARLDSDADFAAAYDRWVLHACAMVSGPGETPRPSVWSAIETRLPANDQNSAKTTVDARLRWWQAGTLVAGTAAAVLAVIALRQPNTVIVRVPSAQQAATAPMVAVLTGKQGVVTISFDPASGRMTSAATGLELKDRSPELWVIPADGKPRSMGTFDPSAPGWGTVPEGASAAMASGVTLAVSVEPVGGSPTGQPTGPVVLTGKLVST